MLNHPSWMMLTSTECEWELTRTALRTVRFKRPILFSWVLHDTRTHYVFRSIRLSVILCFLVTCYATLHSALSVRPSVTYYFFVFFYSLTSLLLPKWSSDLKYGPCPPHATGVAVYPVLSHEKTLFWKVLLIEVLRSLKKC